MMSSKNPTETLPFQFLNNRKSSWVSKTVPFFCRLWSIFINFSSCFDQENNQSNPDFLNAWMPNVFGWILPHGFQIGVNHCGAEVKRGLYYPVIRGL